MTSEGRPRLGKKVEGHEVKGLLGGWDQKSLEREAGVYNKCNLIHMSGAEWAGMAQGSEREKRAVEEPGLKGSLGSPGEERGKKLRGVGCRSLTVHCASPLPAPQQWESVPAGLPHEN